MKIPENVVLFALTGGPCGGKTTALADLRQWFGQLGHVVATVPEAATAMIEHGIGPMDGWRSPIQFQAAAIRRQLFLEDEAIVAVNQFASDKPKIVLCDRGTLDCKAYVTPTVWRRVLALGDWNQAELGARYQHVVHLVTAASGAEHFYTLENNTARHETVPQAIARDQKTQAAWLGIEHLDIVDNFQSFDEKIARVKQILAHALGIPVPVEIERKYRLLSPPDLLRLRPHERVEIVQNYLVSPDARVERRVRMWTQQGHTIYFYAEKEPFAGRLGQRIERQRTIGEREYLSLLREADPAVGTIRKNRYCFLRNGAYWMLDEFLSPRQDLWLLEVELTREADEVRLPKELLRPRGNVFDVTGDSIYANVSIARASA